MRGRASSEGFSDTEVKSWVKLTVKTSPEASDAISDLLFKLGAEGIELKETDSISLLIAYYPADDLVGERIFKIRDFFGKLRESGLDPSPASIELDEIEDENWLESWKAGFKPIRIGNRLIVSPTWCDPELKEGDILVRIDPSMAFGTGQHPTTRFSLELLERAVFKGATVLDVGTGSGILSIAAVKLGARKVTAVDIDHTVIPIARRNAEMNGVADKIELLAGDITAVPPVRKFDVVVANILTKIIVPMLPDIKARLKPGGEAILSGILVSEEEEVIEECAKIGFKHVDSISDEMWTAVRVRG